MVRGTGQESELRSQFSFQKDFTERNVCGAFLWAATHFKVTSILKWLTLRSFSPPFISECTPAWGVFRTEIKLESWDPVKRSNPHVQQSFKCRMWTIRSVPAVPGMSEREIRSVMLCNTGKHTGLGHKHRTEEGFAAAWLNNKCVQRWQYFAQDNHGRQRDKHHKI